MEKLVESKQVHHLGISNVSAEQMTELSRQVRIQPHFVQNRCFANQGELDHNYNFGKKVQ